MTRKSLLFVLLSAIVCCFTLLSSCNPVLTTPLRVGTVSWIGYEPLYLAQELGYFDPQPIEILNYTSGTEVMRAYRNQELDTAALTLGETLAVGQTEPDIYVPLVLDFSYGGDVVLAKPEIKNIADLKGKRVGVESGALGGYMLVRTLQQANLTPRDVVIVSLGLTEHESAFHENRVDAVVTFGSNRLKLIADGARVIFDSRQIPQEIVDVLVTREAVLQQHPEMLQTLVKGWSHSLDYIRQQPEDAYVRIAKRLGITPKEVGESLTLIQIPDLERNQQLLHPGNSTLQRNAQRLVEVMYEQNLLARPVPVDRLFTDAIVKTLENPA